MINLKKTVLFAKAVDYLGYRVTGDGLTFSPQISRLTAVMNGMKAKRKWEVGDWDSKLANQFQELKDLFCLDGGPSHAFPMALGNPGAGKFTLTTDFSKEAKSGVLH